MKASVSLQNEFACKSFFIRNHSIRSLYVEGQKSKETSTTKDKFQALS